MGTVTPRVKDGGRAMIRVSLYTELDIVLPTDIQGEEFCIRAQARLIATLIVCLTASSISIEPNFIERHLAPQPSRNKTLHSPPHAHESIPPVYQFSFGRLLIFTTKAVNIITLGRNQDSPVTIVIKIIRTQSSCEDPRIPKVAALRVNCQGHGIG